MIAVYENSLRKVRTSPIHLGKIVGNTHHSNSNVVVGKVAQRQYYPLMRRRKVKSV